MSVKSYAIHNPSGFPVLLAVAAALAIFLFCFQFFVHLETPSASLILFILGLFPLAFFLHLGNRNWLRVSDESYEVTFVPSLYGRFLSQMEPTSGHFTPDSELLFCRRMSYGYHDGFSILLHTPSLPDKVLWETSTDTSGVSRNWWTRIATDIECRHQLKARLVTLAVTVNGVEQMDWSAATSPGRRKALSLILLASLAPWLGIVARILTANPFKLVLIGTFLWTIVGSLSIYILLTVRVPRPRVRSGGLISSILLWTLQFVTFYTLAVLITGALMHH